MAPTCPSSSFRSHTRPQNWSGVWQRYPSRRCWAVKRPRSLAASTEISACAAITVSDLEALPDSGLTVIRDHSEVVPRPLLAHAGAQGVRLGRAEALLGTQEELNPGAEKPNPFLKAACNMRRGHRRIAAGSSLQWGCTAAAWRCSSKLRSPDPRRTQARAAGEDRCPSWPRQPARNVLQPATGYPA